MPSLGELSQAVIALVAVVGCVEAIRARRQSARNGVTIAQVRKETNGMRAQLENAARASGNLEGRAEQHAEDIKREGTTR
jgi:uncharacterized protein YoxC